MTDMKADMGSSWQVVTGTISFTGIQEDMTDSNELMDGGFMPEDTFMLTAVTADLAGGTYTIGKLLKDATSGISYRIMKAITSKGDPTTKFVMANKESNK